MPGFSIPVPEPRKGNTTLQKLGEDVGPPTILGLEMGKSLGGVTEKGNRRASQVL